MGVIASDRINRETKTRMASSKWKSFEELTEIVKYKTVIFWAASNWLERTVENLPVKAKYVLDNNPNNQGIEYFGLKVCSPEILKQENKDDIYIIICTANYPSVIDELSSLGFVMGENYCVTPLLNERKNKDDLKQIDKKVLVSSPQHSFKSDSGGGIYECHTRTGVYEKKYTGKCRGMSLTDDYLLVIDMLKGLVVLDRKDYSHINTIELQPNCEAHGVYFDTLSGRMFVGQPGRDSIAIYSGVMDPKLEDEIFLSPKWQVNKKDNHHVNDIYVEGDSLYVSMFSFSGNWMNEVYDGGILEIHLPTKSSVGTVVSNLWMPHSVNRFNGQLCYVDSMRGELFNTTWKKVGCFNAFIRGLDYDGKYYYVGASEHRYPEKLIGISENIGLDTGFFIIDPNTKMSRFFQTRATESIHSVIVE